MKSERGITLSSLIIYILVMMIVIGVMTSVSLIFYRNTSNLDNRTVEISKYNNFNTYFIKEIKSPGNGIDTIQQNYILFKSGNSFSFNNNNIYYNNLSIVDGVQNVVFSKPEINDDTVISVNIVFEEFSKNMKYKIEEIY